MLSCSGLWKVYGTQAERVLRAASRSGDAGSTDGLIAAVKAVGGVPAVAGVSFEAVAGETFVIMGLSGSGKSTVVRCLSRLVEPTAGDVRLDGISLLDLSPRQLIELRRRRLGMVFQHFGLMPHMTVLDNVAYPLRVQGVPVPERLARARATIELVGLKGREGSFPRELSGGMQQRVGIARSLAVRPDVWFLDEPFSALDPLIRRQMQDEFVRLRALLHKTIVFITHDFLEAARLADRVAIMREGRIVQIGTPADLVLRPVDAYVAEFTRDAPRGRIITAVDLLEPSGNVGVDDAVTPTTALEALLPRLATRHGPLAVVGEDGAVLGQVSLQRAVQAFLPLAA